MKLKYIIVSKIFLFNHVLFNAKIAKTCVLKQTITQALLVLQTRAKSVPATLFVPSQGVVRLKSCKNGQIACTAII